MKFNQSQLLTEYTLYNKSKKVKKKTIKCRPIIILVFIWHHTMTKFRTQHLQETILLASQTYDLRQK